MCQMEKSSTWAKTHRRAGVGVQQGWNRGGRVTGKEAEWARGEMEQVSYG